MTEILLVAFSIIAVGAALGVVLARSPIASLLFMVTTLASVAGIYVLFEAHFLAAIDSSHGSSLVVDLGDRHSASS